MNPKILCTQVVDRCDELMCNPCWRSGFTFGNLVGLLTIFENSVGKTNVTLKYRIPLLSHIGLSFKPCVITRAMQMVLIA
jgi:hypothetical protein